MPTLVNAVESLSESRDVMGLHAYPIVLNNEIPVIGISFPLQLDSAIIRGIFYCVKNKIGYGTA